MVVSEKGDGEKSPPRFIHQGGSGLISPIQDPPGISENNASALNGARRNLNLYLAGNGSQASLSQGEQASQRRGSQRGLHNGHGQIYAARNAANFNRSRARFTLPFPVRLRRGWYIYEPGAARNGITRAGNAVRNSRPDIPPRSTLPLHIISRYRDIISDAYRNGFSRYRSEPGHRNPLQFSEFCNGQVTPITRIRNASSPPRPEIGIFSVPSDFMERRVRLRRRGGNTLRNGSGRGRGSLANGANSGPPPPMSTNSLPNGVRRRCSIYRPGKLQAEQRAAPQNVSGNTVRPFFANRGNSPPDLSDIAQRHFNPRDFNPAMLTIKQSCNVMATFDLDAHCSTIARTLCMFTLRIYGLEDCPVSDLRLAVFFFIERHFNVQPAIELCVRNIPDNEANVVGVVFERISTKQEILANASILNGTSYRVASNVNVEWVIENYNYLADQQADSNGST